MRLFSIVLERNIGLLKVINKQGFVESEIDEFRSQQSQLLEHKEPERVFDGNVWE